MNQSSMIKILRITLVAILLLDTTVSFTILPSSSSGVTLWRRTSDHHVVRYDGVSSLSSSTTTALRMNGGGGFMDGVSSFLKRFTQKATASHILIKGGAEAANKLEDLKAEINNSPIKFAQYAEQYSQCPSARSGGNLGEFGPGVMVKEFDTVVFNNDVGIVHGPIKTQFGYHLIYINDRTD